MRKKPDETHLIYGFPEKDHHGHKEIDHSLAPPAANSQTRPYRLRKFRHCTEIDFIDLAFEYIICL